MCGDSHENLLEIWAVVIILSPFSSVCGSHARTARDYVILAEKKKGKKEKKEGKRRCENTGRFESEGRFYRIIPCTHCKNWQHNTN